MSDPIDHHHVAQFYLAGWAGEDGRLVVFTRKGGRLVEDRHTPKHTGYEPHLYSIAAKPDDPQWVEREVMSKRVDGPASKVLTRLLSGEVGKLDSDERSAWGRFILAQWRRSPAEIAKLRADADKVITEEIERNPDEYLALRGTAPEKTLREWVDVRFPGLSEIVSMGRILPQVINDPRAGDTIINMNWQVFDLTDVDVPLLTSDRPVTRTHGLGSPECRIYIPLDPRHLFVASHEKHPLQIPDRRKLVRWLNKLTVIEAQERVFASGTEHRPLIEKHFQKKG